MTDLDTYLRSQPGRCPDCGYHLTLQACACNTAEWPTFLAAVKRAARPDGVVSQTFVRPLIQNIAPKRRGQLYRRAVSEHVLVDTGEREPSTDHAGRNSDKLQRLYRLGEAA